jgi:RNA polymerase sigma-70 factor (TIGR02960 family)
VEEFETLVRRHRGELRVHCYRMLGSLDEAEDLAQETFLRAWRNIDRFEGRSSLRAWLYRIATNACLDALDGRSRRILPYDLSSSSPPADVRWLQPFPDRLREPTASQPEAAAVDRETIELAFLAAIQHLPPRQRAALILCDVLGWPAKETAAALDGSAASVNSALQRARATLRDHLPARRQDWTPSTAPTADELVVLRGYMSAVERADIAAVAELLAQEVRATMPPLLDARACGGRRGALGELGPAVAALRRAVPDGPDRGERPARGGRLHPSVRGLPAVRHHRAAGGSRADRGDDRLPRPGAVRGVRSTDEDPGARPSQSGRHTISRRRLTHGQAALFGHDVPGRLHRRARR